MTIKLIHGDALEMLATLPAASVQTIVTSPPFYRLRRYTDDPREIGQEETPAQFAAALVAVFRELRRVLRDDGTAWLNLGDSMSANPGNGRGGGERLSGGVPHYSSSDKSSSGIAPKNLLGIPWRVAFALQDDGWYLRSDIIWSKPNPMPESVTDRPTRSHEYLFLLSKQPRYYYDAAAIAEPAAPDSARASKYGKNDPPPGAKNPGSYTRAAGDIWGAAARNRRTVWSIPDPDSERAAFGLYLTNLARRLMDAGIDSATIGDCLRQAEQDNQAAYAIKGTAWSIATQPYSGAHFATMPEALVAPCIRAGSRAGDTVLDPFAGSGTVLRVAQRFQRDAIGIDLNADYLELQEQRNNGVQIEMDML